MILGTKVLDCTWEKTGKKEIKRKRKLLKQVFAVEIYPTSFQHEKLNVGFTVSRKFKKRLKRRG